MLLGAYSGLAWFNTSRFHTRQWSGVPSGFSTPRGVIERPLDFGPGAPDYSCTHVVPRVGRGPNLGYAGQEKALPCDDGTLHVPEIETPQKCVPRNRNSV